MEIKEVLGGSRNEIVYNLIWEDYRALAGMNPSTLVHGLKSLKHLKFYWDNPGSEDSDAMLLGRALHTLVFEPEQFERRYVRWDTRRAGNAYQEFCDEAEAAGAEVLTGKLFDKAIFAAKNLVASKQIKELITSGQREATLLTSERGLQLKHRLDWIDAANGIIDVKSTRSIDQRAFSRDFYRLRYDVKLGLYQRALRKLTERNWPVTVVVLENAPPYDVAVLPVADAVLDSGVKKGLRVLDQLKHAIETDQWPGVGDGTYVLETPAWEMDEDDVDYEDLRA